MFTNRELPSAIVIADLNRDMVDARFVPGDEVELLLGDEHVSIMEVIQTGPSTFEGRIRAFDPSAELEHQGLRVGDVVEFEEKHIVALKRYRI